MTARPAFVAAGAALVAAGLLLAIGSGLASALIGPPAAIVRLFAWP